VTVGIYGNVARLLAILPRQSPVGPAVLARNRPLRPLQRSQPSLPTMRETACGKSGGGECRLSGAARTGNRRRLARRSGEVS
jgi:hypothetical protein